MSDAKSDFEEAKKRTSIEPEVYLELAKIAENESRYDEARQILEEGLKTVPTSAALYEKLARIHLRDRKIDKAFEEQTNKAIRVLEHGLRKMKSATEQGQIHWFLLSYWPRAVNTGKLLVHIEELKKAGYPLVLKEYLNACYHINKAEFAKARQLLDVDPTDSEPKCQIRIDVESTD